MIEISTEETLSLGIIQGLAEFLPISSSAHLILLSWFWNGHVIPLELNVALHFGTLLAVLIYFWKDFANILIGSFQYRIYRDPKGKKDFNLFLCLFVGSIPAGIFGILFEEKIENYFHHPQMVAGPLLVFGILLWWIDKKYKVTKRNHHVSIKEAFMIGCFQTLALIPGVSRSGSTIIGGRLLGLSRQDSAKFSFLLGTPAMIGATLLKLPSVSQAILDPQFGLGVLTCTLIGCITIKYFLAYLSKFGFGIFMVYRAILAGFLFYNFY